MHGIVIAGTHSGCGKTTVTLGIMAALRKKGFVVQPFKAGPDFIDAGLHRLVADRPSRNLDQWMCGKDYVLTCFAKHTATADISVVEGVMGMYDGDYSTASLAVLLHAPVVLVVDAYGMAESAGAMVKGFFEFGIRNEKCGAKISGVIFNRVASESHYNRLKDSVQGVPVLGYLPRELDFEIPHRHLGLSTAEEHPLAQKNIDKLADTILKYIDVEAIFRNSGIEIVKSEKDFYCEAAKVAKEIKRCKIAVAYDKAFCFYYEDNLDFLRETGAEIVRFSPLADEAIPADVDAVYIGGGYPELHAAALSKNGSMCESVRAWVEAGKPLYAECGGLMYLSKGIRDFDNAFFSMAGVFSFETRMMKKPRLGYREIILHQNCFLGNKGDTYRGHEFHYSEIADIEMRNADCGLRNDKHAELIYTVRDSQGREKGQEGFRYKNTLASYVHVHFGGNERGAEHFAGIKGDRNR